MSQSAQNLHQSATVYDHIRELQMRLIVSVVAMAIAGTVVYFFYAPILALLSSPLKAPLYYNTPAGSFTFVMRICFTGALIVTIPILTYNLIMFVQPAFEKTLTMKRVLVTTVSSTILAIAGAAFAFYCILPGTLAFFKGFQVSGLNALISADNYLGFVTNIIIMFVIVFQIPLLMLFIDIVKPLQPKKLIKLEKWVILGSLIVALLAPFTYDLVTSLLIALPIVLLYNLSIIIVVARHAEVARKARRAGHATFVKPVDNMEGSELSLNELVFESLSDELVNLKKVAPISTIPSGYSVMDVKRPSARPETVKPAAWVEERKARRAALSTQVRVFSDVRRVNPNSNHALASQ
ncbi:MAG TPA: twin-arginine translocase subunit TatC [Candidatus Saccharimonadales bacterium]|nr:twin-arginine translocase subunit TatC [Candidatus Saccharimonadales bacterium]